MAEQIPERAAARQRRVDENFAERMREVKGKIKVEVTITDADGAVLFYASREADRSGDRGAQAETLANDAAVMPGEAVAVEP